MLGEVVGNYRITGAVASGGMGAVYRGEHTLIGRVAAVKVLRPELSANREVVGRFFNEARATAAIRHPGIVEIFDFGQEPGGRAYLVMELLAGESLAARLARGGRVDERTAVAWVRSIASALAAAHDVGIIHRDLKPDNLFLVRDPDVVGGERPKLLDFGIAKLVDPRHRGPATLAGAVLGTPTYMAPEQCRGAEEVDERSDLYALGCLFYELVTGRPPFTVTGMAELMVAHLMSAPTPPRALVPTLSAEVEATILRLLAKEPAARYPSARALLDALGGDLGEAAARVVALPTARSLTTLSGAAGVAPVAARSPRAGRIAVAVAAVAVAMLTLAISQGLGRQAGHAIGAATSRDAGPRLDAPRLALPPSRVVEGTSAAPIAAVPSGAAFVAPEAVTPAVAPPVAPPGPRPPPARSRHRASHRVLPLPPSTLPADLEKP
jgi:tRNA A-37 threonylcarbamoyl transferase component Bud32